VENFEYAEFLHSTVVAILTANIFESAQQRCLYPDTFHVQREALNPSPLEPLLMRYVWSQTYAISTPFHFVMSCISA
jgi:hypothetical protein